MTENVLDALSNLPQGLFWIAALVVLWLPISAAAFVLVSLITAMSAWGGVSITASPLVIAPVIGFLITGAAYLLVSWEVPW